jgi:hypothetical protein
MRELTLDRLPKEVLAKLDLETVFNASRCVLAAERLLVFSKLGEEELSAGDISRRTGIVPEHCQSFLDFLAFLGLLEKRGSLYRNSSLTKQCFLRARSVEWSQFWAEECAKDFEALTVVENVLTSGRDWRELLGLSRESDYDLVVKDPLWAKNFTYALYDVYSQQAKLLPEHLDLSIYRSLLDVGGGSGVWSFALARAYPQLKVRILDFEFVCDAANEIILREGLTHRITTVVGDMNKAIPSGSDVIMFWNIGHIDTRVMKMAFESLPEGGMVVRDCTPPSRSKAPSPNAFLRRYLSIRPKGQTKRSAMDSLRTAGFRSVKYRRISPSFSLITGLKGRARRQRSIQRSGRADVDP